MIVRSFDNAIQLITQPDHAHLARAIMDRCAPLVARPRRQSILLAIGEHDNGWADEDAAPTVNPATGTIVDFVGAPLNVRHRVWPQAVARLAHDPWAAALVAHHAIAVYDRFRPQSDWSSFFSEMEATRDAILRASKMSIADLIADYPFLRLGDLISLAFCTGATEEYRLGEWTIQLTGASVLVAHDMFAGARIPVEIAAREIPKQRFRADEELRVALASAKTTILRGEVAGPVPAV